jgi:Mn2+/Fe2+ NRAMP family transporter
MAGAAIGVSHLVQSTRAGAEYGYVAAVLIVAACLFKYPFLEYGPRYAAATGESLLDGYRRLGTWAMGVFGLLTVGTMFIVLAGVTAVTAGLMGWLAGTTPNLALWSGVVLGTCILILMVGRYQLLDRVMKVVMALLAASTVIAAVAALMGPAPAMVEEAAGPGALLTTSGIAFSLALMGWMPVPIDVSAWHSLWTLERERDTGTRLDLRDVQADFAIGYALSLLMALAFLVLGSAIMYGTGTEFGSGAVAFATQVVDLYTTTLGTWAGTLVGIAALTTMLSTTLAVTDAYGRLVAWSTAYLQGTPLAARTLARAPEALAGQSGPPSPERAAAPSDSAGDVEALQRYYRLGLFITPLGAWAILALLVSSLTALVDVATTIAFLAGPVLGAMNYYLVCSDHMPEHAQPSTGMRALSWAGLVFLVAFCVAYVVV